MTRDTAKCHRVQQVLTRHHVGDERLAGWHRGCLSRAGSERQCDDVPHLYYVGDGDYRQSDRTDETEDRSGYEQPPPVEAIGDCTGERSNDDERNEAGKGDPTNSVRRTVTQFVDQPTPSENLRPS